MLYRARTDSKRVTIISQFTTLEQEREREIKSLGKRQALYTHSYFPRGVKNGQVAPPFAECGILPYFRRGALSSLGLFTGLCGVVACRFPSLFLSHVLFFLLHRCEQRTTCNSFALLSPAPYPYSITRMQCARPV